MKIAHLTTAHKTFDNRIFQKECKSLAREGYEVVLISLSDRDQEIEGVRLRAVSASSGRLKRILLSTFKVFRATLEERPNLVHIHDPELLPVGQLLVLLGYRVVFDMHENLPKAILAKPWIRPVLRPLVSSMIKIVERLLLLRLPVVFAEKSYAKDYAWVKRHVNILNFPIVQRLLEIEGDRFCEPTLGYIGGVSPERGCMVTLDALRLLNDAGTEVQFDCVGPHYHPSNEQRMRQTIGNDLSGLVRLHGYLDSDEGLAVISRCHIGLAVLKNVPNYVESFPTKMFEYMALGMPVIVSDFPLYREIVDSVQCGLCIDPDRPEDLASAVKWLIDHPAEAEAMGKRGKQAVQDEFNWDFESKKLATFYRDILA